jgi:hypothetical protein
VTPRLRSGENLSFMTIEAFLNHIREETLQRR